MINTRETICKSLMYRFKKLFKQADNNPKAFKKILYAVIINDLIEWCDYKGEEKHRERLDLLLKKYLQNNPEFTMVRQYFTKNAYKNVNLPQSNWTYRAYSELSSHSISPDPIGDKIKLYIWNGETWDISTLSEEKYFEINANTNPVKFRVTNTSLEILHAINKGFRSDDCAELFVKEIISENENTYAEFTLTLREPLEETLEITLS